MYIHAHASVSYEVQYFGSDFAEGFVGHHFKDGGGSVSECRLLAEHAGHELAQAGL